MTPPNMGIAVALERIAAARHHLLRLSNLGVTEESGPAAAWEDAMDALAGARNSLEGLCAQPPKV